MAAQSRDYTEFDKKMIALIKEGKNTAAALTGALDAEAKLLMAKPREEFRLVDRRLQALRKKGVISWERRGAFVVWSVNS
ncbi:MAG: hypothetical protein K2W33_07550 [Burkholderiales bacterium]|nr:hypothetical protein [Burkholderiales bacterium]